MKTKTIILIGILFLIFIVGLGIYSQKEIVYDFYGVKISKNNFDTLSENFGSHRFTLCNLEDGKCVRMNLKRLEEDG